MSFARNTSPAASSYTMAPDEPYCPYNEFDIALFKQPYNAELRTTSERVAAARSGSARAPLVDGTPSSCSSDAEWAGNYHSKPLENGVALDERNDGACKACREQHTKCVRGPDGKCDACSRRGMSCNPAAPRKKGRAPDMTAEITALSHRLDILEERMKKDEGLREYPEEGTPDTASASNNTLVSGIADGGRLDEVVERNPATEPMARSQPSNQGPSEHNGGVYSNPDATLTCLLPSPSLPDHPWQTWCPPAQTSQYDPQLPWWVLVASPSEIAGETYCSVNGK